MRREQLPVDDVDQGAVMLAVVLIGVAAAASIWVMFKFALWVFAS